jgi:hypothetical protein
MQKEYRKILFKNNKKKSLIKVSCYDFSGCWNFRQRCRQTMTYFLVNPIKACHADDSNPAANIGNVAYG